MTGSGNQMNVDPLIDLIRELAQRDARVLIAVAGPPGAGKSTFAAGLVARLDSVGQRAAVVPMDGFHFDNAILEERGLTARKGSPPSFDTAGFSAMLDRLRREDDVAIPIFDRKLDLGRMSAFAVTRAHRVLVVEGNYLLLDTEPWISMRAVYHCAIWINAPKRVLKERLVQRWVTHGLTRDAAEQRARDNDLANVDLVLHGSGHPDFSFATL